MRSLSSNLRQTLHFLLRPSTIRTFAIATLGATALNVLGNSVFVMFYHFVFQNRPEGLLVLIGGTLLFLAVCGGLLAWRGRPLIRALQRIVLGPPRVGDGELFRKIPRKGVIFTLGLSALRPDSMARWVFHELNPEFVGFLGTPKTDEMEISEKLAIDFGLPAERVKSESWEPAEFAEGRIKAGLVIDWMRGKGLDRSSIVVDLTGGLVPHSIIAFLAAEDRRVDTEYILSDYDQVHNRVIEGSQKAVLITHYSGSGSSESRSEVAAVMSQTG